MRGRSRDDTDVRRFIHDMRNSLGSAQLRLAALVRTSLTPEQQRHVEAASRELRHQADVIEDLSRANRRGAQRARKEADGRPAR
jgi:signal transduction histidine kinase